MALAGRVCTHSLTQESVGPAFAASMQQRAEGDTRLRPGSPLERAAGKLDEAMQCSAVTENPSEVHTLQYGT